MLSLSPRAVEQEDELEAMRKELAEIKALLVQRS